MRDNDKFIYTVVAVNETKKYVEDISFVEDKNKALRKALAYITAYSNIDDDKVSYISTDFHVEYSKAMVLGCTGFPEVSNVFSVEHAQEIDEIIRTAMRYELSNHNTYGNMYPVEFGKEKEEENND